MQMKCSTAFVPTTGVVRIPLATRDAHRPTDGILRGSLGTAAGFRGRPMVGLGLGQNPSQKHPSKISGPMPNVMAAQPNIVDAVCESSVIPFLVPRRKVWLTPAVEVPCSRP